MSPGKTKAPSVVGATNRAHFVGSGLRPEPRPTTAKAGVKSRVKPNVTVRLADGTVLSVQGREAQTLSLLMRRGPARLTSGEASGYGWSRRTSAYVRKLRLAGVPTVTASERILDARIGRYYLVGPVSVVSEGGGL